MTGNQEVITEGTAKERMGNNEDEGIRCLGSCVMVTLFSHSRGRKNRGSPFFRITSLDKTFGSKDSAALLAHGVEASLHRSALKHQCNARSSHSKLRMSGSRLN